MSRGRAITQTGRKSLASHLRAMGEAAERAARDDEFLVLKDGLAPLFEALDFTGYPADYERFQTATRQLLEGAFESAILGLIPDNATVSGHRIGRQMVTATVALEGQQGYRTEAAASLALGWYIVFAYALADLVDE